MFRYQGELVPFRKIGIKYDGCPQLSYSPADTHLRLCRWMKQSVTSPFGALQGRSMHHDLRSANGSLVFESIHDYHHRPSIVAYSDRTNRQGRREVLGDVICQSKSSQNMMGTQVGSVLDVTSRHEEKGIPPAFALVLEPFIACGEGSVLYY
ncbi:hypothetical protein CCHR01_15683 [Colletotrichum chrysophilum]|uniref:Uncharacterized protein n=1 Tax=Colletotrichum chrysophilum TaxID=1836956 RepID=A0AAD9EBK0_9PEZI|nr:hypothetical protein CCHR01_15683 [Colletotrichum chrysophilum]